MPAPRPVGDRRCAVVVTPCLKLPVVHVGNERTGACGPGVGDVPNLFDLEWVVVDPEQRLQAKAPAAGRVGSVCLFDEREVF